MYHSPTRQGPVRANLAKHRQPTHQQTAAPAAPAYDEEEILPHMHRMPVKEQRPLIDQQLTQVMPNGYPYDYDDAPPSKRGSTIDYRSRTGTSAQVPAVIPQRQRQVYAPRDTSEYEQLRPRRWLRGLVGKAFLVMAAFIIIGSITLIGTNWIGSAWQRHLDDGYGNPRTFQMDGVTGFFDDAAHKSHFVLYNDRGKIMLVIVAGKDPTKSEIITVMTELNDPTGENPATMELKDVNGDGLPDIVVTIHNTSGVAVLINDPKIGFRPLKPGENVNI